MANITGVIYESILKAKDTTSGAFSSAKKNVDQYAINNERAAQRSKKAWERYKKQLKVELVAAFAALTIAAKKAFDYLDEMATMTAQIQAADALAKQYDKTAYSIVNDLKNVTDQMLSVDQATQILQKGIKNLDPQTIIELTKHSRSLAALTGQDLVSSFNKLDVAIVKGTTSQLQQLGIFVDLNKIYSDYASEIGKNVKNLSEEEKFNARKIGILEEINNKYKNIGSIQMSLADQLQVYKSAFEDWQLYAGASVLVIINSFKYLYSAGKEQLARLNLFFVEVMDKIEYSALDAVRAILEKFAILKNLGIDYVDSMLDNATDKINELINKGDQSTDAYMQAAKSHVALLAAETEKASAIASMGINKTIETLSTSNVEMLDNTNNKVNEVYSNIQTKTQETYALYNEAFSSQMEQEQALHLMRLQQEEAEFQSYLEYKALYDEMKLLEEEEQLSKFEIDLENIRQQYEEQLNIINDYYNAKIALAQSDTEKQKLLNEKEIASARKKAQMEQAIDQQYSSFYYQSIRGMFEAWSSQSKTAFEIFKAIQIAETVQSTASTAIKSYEAMASIPYVGPALGAAAAAAAIAYGAARINEIRQTSYNSAHTGGYIGGVEDEPLYKVQRGEYVVSRKGVNALDRLNSGNVSGVGETSLTINVNTYDASDFGDFLEDRDAQFSSFINKKIRLNN